MRILIIEDEKDICAFLKEALEAECFSVDTANDGEQGSLLAKTDTYDLILLDNVLPNKQGIEICREIREKGKSVPIIMISVRNELISKVEHLNNGADDYITKPFSFIELLARIKAILRRPKQYQNQIFTIDDLVIDINKHTVKRGPKEIYLTRKEFQLLEFLLLHKDSVVSRTMIMEHVWDIHADLFSNTIETHVLNLRKKINATGRRKLIHTVPGRGYKIM